MRRQGSRSVAEDRTGPAAKMKSVTLTILTTTTLHQQTSSYKDLRLHISDCEIECRWIFSSTLDWYLVGPSALLTSLSGLL